jgi:farnesyl diphosphate synthase
MDNSELRRGRPTVHKRFDDATAVLAGDGLLTLAFEILADPATHPAAEVRAELVLSLARAAGVAGMVGGQMIDLEAEKKHLDLAAITQLQQLKTGALFGFASEAGAILGRLPVARRAALRAYAADIGLAFQIADDLLDAEGSATAIGKPVGQDKAAGKATFLSLLGPDRARNEARRLAADACKRLEPFGPPADPLRAIAHFIVVRRR